MPETDLDLLERAAREAGEIALHYWRREPEAWEKDDNQGPVSEADLAVNAHLERVLRDARPDYGWLSEESADDASRLDARRCFIVDPIDGTRAFLDGQTGFSHSLAIAEQDRVVTAVVYLPAQQTLYEATAEGPALCNGKEIHGRGHDIDGATVLTNRPALHADMWKSGEVPPMIREFRPSLAWRLCLVAEGRFNAALSLRSAWEWDIAAGSLIAERAHCRATDRRNRDMRFNNSSAQLDGMVVAPPRLHAQIIDRLAL